MGFFSLFRAGKERARTEAEERRKRMEASETKKEDWTKVIELVEPNSDCTVTFLIKTTGEALQMCKNQVLILAEAVKAYVNMSGNRVTMIFPDSESAAALRRALE